MDRFSVYYAGFSASHIAPGATRTHGHDWRIIIEAKGDESSALQASLDAICRELRDNPLEAMMPGASTTAIGIGNWIYERLAMSYPELTRVEVTCAEHHGYLVAEARRG